MEQLGYIYLSTSYTIPNLHIRVFIISENGDIFSFAFPIHTTLLDEEILKIRKIVSIR